MFYSAGGRFGYGARFFNQRRGCSGLSRQSVLGRREGYSLAFVVVVALFVTTLITANITAVKLIGFWGLVLPAAVVVFPVSYICGDVLTEGYGDGVGRGGGWGGG